MKKLLFAMAIGAALAWLFDPESGARRRAVLRRKLEEQGWAGGSTAPAAPPTVVGANDRPLVAAR